MATGGMLTPGFGLHESQYGPAELATTAAVAHDAGLPITAHAHGPQGIADAPHAGVDGIEHGRFFTPTGIEPDGQTVAGLATAGTRYLQALAHMHAQGVRITCGSDAGIGPRRPHDVLPTASRSSAP